jgi:hypothetical protein
VRPWIGFRISRRARDSLGPRPPGGCRAGVQPAGPAQADQRPGPGHGNRARHTSGMPAWASRVYCSTDEPGPSRRSAVRVARHWSWTAPPASATSQPWSTPAAAARSATASSPTGSSESRPASLTHPGGPRRLRIGAGHPRQAGEIPVANVPGRQAAAPDAGGGRARRTGIAPSRAGSLHPEQGGAGWRRLGRQRRGSGGLRSQTSLASTILN